MGAETERAGVIRNDAKEQAVAYCLEQMDALAQELGKAMSAIAANSPASLEQSIQLQHGRVNSVTAALDTVRKSGEMPGSSSAAHPSAMNLDSRISKAARKLWSLNEQYAALLEHSGRSMRMLKALYGHASVPPNERPSVGQYRTWSWEG